ncbi:phosphate regulon sensor histidine kinase PhoR [Methylomagnum ishizawai]|uniref:phosphate regulon sensor histidine kinase PhoR n=1 Tax=Methylomagnum ishizawai TaxID=1760988 RepID=UPI001C339CBA|nr:phosphate regulon sensor histidine kinase PhoR [Methylomagnum ishizawai]BBL76929.1 phosphate regulon sensor protein PhoR [Methylomagnum ishizawai]
MSPWRSELSFVLLSLLFGAFFAKLFNQASLVLWLCLVSYLARHLFFVNRLLAWLQGGRASQMPQGDGVWEEIYYLIFRLRRRNKRRKKQLIQMLERFRTATAALPDATVVLGPRDEIDWFNEAAGQLLGLRRGDIGQQIGNLLRYPKFTDYLKRKDYHQATVGIPSPAAENVQLEIRVVPYGDDLRLLVAQDVTQLRFMERVRTDFIANVSHELRTPLTVLKGYLETLSDADATPPAYLKVFRRMEEQTTRMQSLIDGLLSLTRLESGAHALVPKPVDVPALLRLIREEAGLLSERGPEIELRLETQAGLMGAESELRSAFSNLVVNAVKYTPPAGRVTMRWRDEGQGARLDVEDTGPGIAQEHLPRLTERFYRVDVEGGKSGSGLGLAIAKHVMARHGAELKIASTPGKGSCFSCCFGEQRVIRALPPAVRATAA